MMEWTPQELLPIIAPINCACMASGIRGEGRWYFYGGVTEII